MEEADEKGVDELAAELGVSRRAILAWLGAGACACAGAALGTVAGQGALAADAAAEVDVGAPADYPVGTTKVFAKARILVVRDANGIHAMTNVCTHAGGPISPGGGKLTCGWHGAQFDVLGNVTKGPARVPLRWLQVRQRGGRLVVNLKQVVPTGTNFVPTP